MYSDNGNSFQEKKQDLLVQLGFARHASYPAAVHQYLSPNDNKLHGTAKRKWKTSGVDFSDDVASSISLLHHIDECSGDV